MRRKLKFDEKRFKYYFEYYKAMRVINGCKTIEQLKSAVKYSLFWFEKYEEKNKKKHDVNCLINMRNLLIDKAKLLYVK